MSNPCMRQDRISGRPLIYTHLVFSQRALWHICLLPLSQASYIGLLYSCANLFWVCLVLCWNHADVPQRASQIWSSAIQSFDSTGSTVGCSESSLCTPCLIEGRRTDMQSPRSHTAQHF